METQTKRTIDDPNKIGFTYYYGGTILKKVWFDELNEGKALSGLLVSASDKITSNFESHKKLNFLPRDFESHITLVKGFTFSWIAADKKYNRFFQSPKINVPVGFFLTMLVDYDIKK